jgi:hypothetical protein
MYIQRSLGAMGRNVVRVWDGAGRCNGRRTLSERCYLVEMGRAVERRRWTTDTHHETTRPGLRTDSGSAGKRQANDSATQTQTPTQTQTQTQARPGRGTQHGLLFRLRHAENSWGAELSLGSLLLAGSASPKHRQSIARWAGYTETRRLRDRQQTTDDRYRLQ